MNPRNPIKTRPTAADRNRLLSERFQPAAGERAPAGFADRYACVYEGPCFLGLVAVDAERGVWYAAADRGRAELEARLKASGFRHAPNNSLASIYFGLAARLHAAPAPFAGAAALRPAAPVAPAIPFPAPRREEAPAPALAPERIASVA